MTTYFKKEKKHYPVEDYLLKKEKNQYFCDLYKALESLISIDKAKYVSTYSTSNRIAWQNDKVFAEFHICAKKLVIHTNKPTNKQKIIGIPIPKTHMWSELLNWKIELTNSEDIADIIEYLKQAYEKA